ncbi:asparagine synthase-related protein [Pontixanthobacter gangjinensis]|uniref:asparagine synthase (glutamine-hydrolyzing) n=1 Tax=Pontixanthobacter gangjinensis TaxID=1028742 RepID=A0A6I4SRU8_9SPHN|nr:asparagine synthase-related protein [Pontixanthobacter gangjinensis]MXO57657.1 hypothetical protein [Pontixanthobacter gangjinensis]
MSVLFGILALSDTAVPEEAESAIIEATRLWPDDRCKAIWNERWLIGCKHRFNVPQSPLAQQPFNSASDENLLVIFDGRIDNRLDLASKLSIDLDENTTDEYLISRAFAEYRTELGQHLIGDFAIAILDRSANHLYLIRDQMGVRPLFIASNQEFFAFASNQAALLALPWVDRTLDETWIADTLLACKVDVTSTAYRGIAMLPAAHWMAIEINVHEPQRYWQLELKHEHVERTDAEYIAEFRDLLFDAVRCRMRRISGLATEMSGGLDSTSIAVIASKLVEPSGDQIEAWSHVMPADNIGQAYPYADESTFIRSVCEMNPLINHRWADGRGMGIAASLRRASKVHSGPARSDLSLGSEEIFDALKANDIRVLLSGFGGDQLVTSHGSGWEQDCKAKKDWQTLRHEIWIRKASLTRRWATYLRQRLGLLDRIISGFRRPKPNRKIALMASGLRSDFARRTGYPQRAFVNPTRQLKGTVAERELDVIQSPHVVYRLEDSAVGAASYGVDYRYPLLDIRLLQFCLNLPVEQKLRGGSERRMIRQAMIGLLPDIVRLRHDKAGATVPTIHQKIFRDRMELIDDLNLAFDKGILGSFVHKEPICDHLIDMELSAPPHRVISPKFILRTCMLAAMSSGYENENKAV